MASSLPSESSRRVSTCSRSSGANEYSSPRGTDAHEVQIDQLDEVGSSLAGPVARVLQPSNHAR